MTNENYNQRVIDEFRANRGRAVGSFGDRPLLLLTTTGRNSGRRLTNPVMYLADGDRVLVFASKAGAPDHPDWYRNLLAYPDVTVEIGEETFEARAVSLAGAERDELYARQVAVAPQFGEYQEKTKRTIPVVALERKR